LGDISRYFEELLNSKNPRQRGSQFERLIAMALEDEQYQVLRNPKSAKPRQTDLFASDDKCSYLFETKWMIREINVADIVQLRDRLNRAPIDFVGCVVSMSDYADSALDEILRDRRREIVPFNAFEVAAIMYRRASIKALIEEKRRALRTQGRLWFHTGRASNAKLSVPEAAESIWVNDEVLPYFSSSTKDHDLVLTIEMPYIATTYAKSSFAIQQTLEIQSTDDLIEVLNLIHKHVGLTPHGSFAIHQSAHGWYGFGASKFVQAIRSWEERYHALGWESWHHSEELAYYDRVDGGGVLCLTARQRVGKRVFIHTADLEIRLPGIPLNTASLNELSAALRNGASRFHFVPAAQTKTYVHHLSSKPKITPVARLLSSRFGERSVAGYVIENPFYGKTDLLATKMRTDFDDFFLRLAANNRFLWLSLTDWIDDGDEIDRIDMFRLEAMWAGRIPVFWANGTWRNIVRRKPATSADDRFERLTAFAPRYTFEDVVRQLRRKKRK
jgi:hypothetical protein